jgi:hypothetical protein
MNIGGEDFALAAGMEPTEETLLMPKQQMIFAARAAGLMPLGFIASVAGFGDWDAFRRMVRRSRQFGFMGASCIHPGQVPIVNEEYSPTAEELELARKIVSRNCEGGVRRPRLLCHRRQDDRRPGGRAGASAHRARRRHCGARGAKALATRCISPALFDRFRHRDPVRTESGPAARLLDRPMMSCTRNGCEERSNSRMGSCAYSE